MEPKTGTQILIAWAPFLVLITFWIGFMLYFRFSPAIVHRRAWIGQTLHHLQRIEELQLFRKIFCVLLHDSFRIVEIEIIPCLDLLQLRYFLFNGNALW